MRLFEETSRCDFCTGSRKYRRVRRNTDKSKKIQTSSTKCRQVGENTDEFSEM